MTSTAHKAQTRILNVRTTTGSAMPLMREINGGALSAFWFEDFASLDALECMPGGSMLGIDFEHERLIVARLAVRS